jgi:hypothetical protein
MQTQVSRCLCQGAGGAYIAVRGRRAPFDQTNPTSGLDIGYGRTFWIENLVGCFPSSITLGKATKHTCTLRRAMKLNIPKITKDSYQNMMIVYKNK